MTMQPIAIGRGICGDPEAASQLEWLETNGLGGFASSSIIGMNTRRYHGLLTAATRPPVGRVVMLSKLEETVTVAGRKYELACNRYPGTLHPTGYRYLREFRLDPFPVFVFDLDGVTVEKRVFMVAGENTTVIEYGCSADCALELRPLIAFRDYHSTTHRNDALNPNYQDQGGMVVLRPYEELASLFLAHNAASVVRGAGWYDNFEFDRERERGLDFREDLFNPLALTFRIASGDTATVIASTISHHANESAALREREAERRAALVAAAPRGEPLVQRLTAAADQFLVRRGEWKTVIAGYPWFSDWGRDTMIALPGLTLVTGRYQAARSILLAFANSMNEGMVPNRFPDNGKPAEYNTVDATLWFFEAVRAYGEYTGDYDFIRKSLFPAMQSSIQWHLRGTRYGIRVASDGLLACGEPGVQLTWMDAKVGDWVVTPRHGKPVEIQALWYNVLRIMQSLAVRFGEPAAAEAAGELADQARGNFRALFWNEQIGCLYDVVDNVEKGEVRDAAVRPNQILAVSLKHRMLEDADARRVLDVVERELLTPVGLRTLSPHDPQYRGRYQGDVVSRDSAYHQGTVWPWLMGPFLTAYARLRGGSEPARWLAAFETQLQSGCLGQIGEVADGDPPHTPRGCVAQAWSVAELLRAAVETASQP
jgi:predicted glycogen debranching enzyme